MTKQHSDESYPSLRQLLGGYFHQDFDIEGETLEEIMAAYRSAATAGDAAGVRSDIDNFLRGTPDNVDATFVATFHPDVDPAGWGMTTKQWLTRIRDLLSVNS